MAVGVYSGAAGLGRESLFGWIDEGWTAGISPFVTNCTAFGCDVQRIPDAQLLVIQTGALAGALVRLVGEADLAITGDFQNANPTPLQGTITGFVIYDRYQDLLIFDDPNNQVLTFDNQPWDGQALAAVSGLAIEAAALLNAKDPASLAAAFASGDDTVQGSRSGEWIEGLGGDDGILGGGGKDRLFGGAGSDSLLGGKAGDRLEGQAGDDEVYGQKGNDLARGGGDDDLIQGNGGRDRLFGNAGNDTLDGGGAKDRLFGGARDDVLAGGGGDDLLVGGAGDDVFVFRGGFGSDKVRDFVSGSDMLQFRQGSGEAQSLADFVAAADQVGRDVVYDAGADGQNVITLVNVRLDSLTEADISVV